MVHLLLVNSSAAAYYLLLKNSKPSYNSVILNISGGNVEIFTFGKHLLLRCNLK